MIVGALDATTDDTDFTDERTFVRWNVSEGNEVKDEGPMGAEFIPRPARGTRTEDRGPNHPLCHCEEPTLSQERRGGDAAISVRRTGTP